MFLLFFFLWRRISIEKGVNDYHSNSTWNPKRFHYAFSAFAEDKINFIWMQLKVFIIKSRPTENLTSPAYSEKKIKWKWLLGNKIPTSNRKSDTQRTDAIQCCGNFCRFQLRNRIREPSFPGTCQDLTIIAEKLPHSRLTTLTIKFSFDLTLDRTSIVYRVCIKSFK